LLECLRPPTPTTLCHQSWSGLVKTGASFGCHGYQIGHQHLLLSSLQVAHLLPPYIPTSTVQPADITMGCGCEITDDARSLMHTDSRPSKWIWPTEHPSRSKDLQAWQRGLQLLSSPGSTLQWGDHLGAWTACPYQLWDWYHVPWARRLYFRMDGGWAEFRACSLRWRRNMPSQCTNVTRLVLSHGSQRATVIVDWQGTAICSGSAPDCIPPLILFASINDLIASWGNIHGPYGMRFFRRIWTLLRMLCVREWWCVVVKMFGSSLQFY
jgi:hypothetical protein